MKKEVRLSYDMGGTYLKSAIFDMDLNMIHEFEQIKTFSNEKTITNFDNNMKYHVEIIKKYLLEHDYQLVSLSISAPGPFNYYTGECLMTRKFRYLNHINIIDYFNNLFNIQDLKINITHDVNACLLGSLYSYHYENKNVACLTIGTGLGFSIYKDHILRKTDIGTPKEELYYLPYKDGVLEDYYSNEAFVKYCKKQLPNINSTYDLYLLAKDNNQVAISLFEEYGKVIANAMNTYINNDIDTLFIGGQVSKAKEFFANKIKETLKNKNIEIIYLNPDIDYSLIGTILDEYK